MRLRICLFFSILLTAVHCAFCAEGSSSVKAENGIPRWEQLLAETNNKGTREKPAIVSIPKGKYHLYHDQCRSEELYISNARQVNPKRVGLVIRNLKNVVIDFNDSELLLHGLVLPIVMENCENCTLQNLHIDSPSPLVQQLSIVRNDKAGLVVRPADWVRYQIQDGKLVFVSDQWSEQLSNGMAYDPKTKHILPCVPGIDANFTNVTRLPDGTLLCPHWNDKRLVPGTLIALRPNVFIQTGIMLYHNTNTTLRNIKIHYASCKAITAQFCENLHYDGVSICRRGDDDPRCFTANADACHFSACKGKIVVENGLFESMMDDAINVHGIYMKVSQRINTRTIHVTFPQPGAWGIEWARPGDVLQFIHSRQMDHYPGTWSVKSIKAVDKPGYFGAKTFEIEVDKDLPDFVQANNVCGVENLTQTAQVVYRNNVIRNNRARGCLFSTPMPVVVENCTFDHVSGTAILFCGDCNGWYESGACRNVQVRNNRFINCMTSNYQYCNAIISIFPEIPDFARQTKYYYGGQEHSFVFENNTFNTFDIPILYARSIDGLDFQKNTISYNNDYKVSDGKQTPFVLEKVNRVRICDNQFNRDFQPQRDVKVTRSTMGSVLFSSQDSFGDHTKSTRDQTWFAYRSFHKEAKTTKQFADEGITVRCFYAAHTCNSMGQNYCEYPLIWNGIGQYNWSAYDAQVNDLLAANPNEKLICIIDLNTPYWATRKFAYDSFSSITRAASDPLWYEITTKWMTDFLQYSEERYGDKIVAYVLAAGGTSEWYEYDRGESSRIKRHAWIKWCKSHGLDFGPDTPPDGTLHTAAFENIVYDPAKEPEKIAYWQFHNEIIVNAMKHYAQVARELVPNKALGYFFGYYLVSDPRLVYFGHLDYERIYADPNIDFFISPGNYMDRGMGCGGGPQLVQGTLARYGKTYLHEIDHGTHVSPDWKVWHTQSEDEAGLKRETAYSLINHGSLWIFDMWGKRFTVEKTRKLLGNLKQIADRYRNDSAPSTAQVLMIADPQSAYGLNDMNPFVLKMAEGMQNKLNRLGTAYDVYSFNDLAEMDLRQYKAIILAGTTLVTPQRAKILKERVCRDNRLLFWCYAPGISNGKTLDTTRCQQWTGVPRETQGVAVTEHGGWTSVYARNIDDLTTAVFRENMKKAGVHFWLDEEVPVYANERLVMLHVKNGGNKTISLPRKYTKATEVYSGRTACENASSFQWDFQSPDTVLFELE